MGVPLAAVGIVFSLLGCWYESALQPGSLGYVFLLGAGAVLALGGGLWAFLGTSRLRALVVPLVFLLFAVPVPESVIAALTAPLRTIATAGATFLLQAGGVAAHREGNIIELANGSVGVDDACSGIRSVWVLLAFAAFMLAVMRMPGFRALLLLLVVPVMAMAANLVRVGLSAWAVASGHAELAEGNAHELLGSVTTAAAAAGIVGLGLALGRSRRTRVTQPVAGSAGVVVSSVAPDRHPAWGAPVAICGLLLLGTLTREGVAGHYRQRYSGWSKPIAVARRSLVDLPTAIGGGRHVTIHDLTPGELEMLKPDDQVVMACSDPSGVTIHLRVLYWKPEQVRLSRDPYVLCPHSPDVCYPAAGWVSDSLFEPGREFPWSNGEQVGVRIFRKLDRESLLFFWQDFGSTDARLIVPAEIKARVHALLRSWTVPPTACWSARYAVAVYGETGGDVPGTRAVLESFCRELAPLLPAFGIGKGADGGEAQ